MQRFPFVNVVIETDEGLNVFYSGLAEPVWTSPVFLIFSCGKKTKKKLGSTNSGHCEVQENMGMQLKD